MNGVSYMESHSKLSLPSPGTNAIQCPPWLGILKRQPEHLIQPFPVSKFPKKDLLPALCPRHLSRRSPGISGHARRPMRSRLIVKTPIS